MPGKDARARDRRRERSGGGGSCARPAGGGCWIRGAAAARPSRRTPPRGSVATPSLPPRSRPLLPGPRPSGESRATAAQHPASPSTLDHALSTQEQANQGETLPSAWHALPPPVPFPDRHLPTRRELRPLGDTPTRPTPTSDAPPPTPVRATPPPGARSIPSRARPPRRAGPRAPGARKSVTRLPPLPKSRRVAEAVQWPARPPGGEARQPTALSAQALPGCSQQRLDLWSPPRVSSLPSPRAPPAALLRSCLSGRPLLAFPQTPQDLGVTPYVPNGTSWVLWGPRSNWTEVGQQDTPILLSQACTPKARTMRASAQRLCLRR
ncbi:proline-rich receptor-like protein kinase PERK10 [Peromyscus leucopus]|uniref:proline-rich receptor-like protein kinase PERK10 n=1 Tax=Peromyscus leucopus TaxID=10041 RepID=UPI0010A1ED1D|nr:proline-rich receptor-like protein kinase PERK10 [Peromyscus leucopus]